MSIAVFYEWDGVCECGNSVWLDTTESATYESVCEDVFDSLAGDFHDELMEYDDELEVTIYDDETRNVVTEGFIYASGYEFDTRHLPHNK